MELVSNEMNGDIEDHKDKFDSNTYTVYELVYDKVAFLALIFHLFGK